MSVRKLVFFACLLLFSTGLLVSCAETPDGTIVMNEETIENFFDKDGPQKSWNPPSQLNLLLDQPVADADIPPLPEGFSRICGVLESAGPYTPRIARQPVAGNGLRGSTFSHGVFGMLGDAGNAGNAWFYADINPKTGEITQARAYMYGFMGGVCDMRQKSGGSYGTISQAAFRIAIDGPCLFPDVSGSTSEFALLVEGAGNILDAPAGKSVSVKYIVNDTGNFTSIPSNPQNYSAIFDYGTGTAHIQTSIR